MLNSFLDTTPTTMLNTVAIEAKVVAFLITFIRVVLISTPFGFFVLPIVFILNFIVYTALVV
jgi:hypothetical protein